MLLPSSSPGSPGAPATGNVAKPAIPFFSSFIFSRSSMAVPFAATFPHIVFQMSGRFITKVWVLGLFSVAFVVALLAAAGAGAWLDLAAGAGAGAGAGASAVRSFCPGAGAGAGALWAVEFFPAAVLFAARLDFTPV